MYLAYTNALTELKGNCEALSRKLIWSNFTKKNPHHNDKKNPGYIYSMNVLKTSQSYLIMAIEHVTVSGI